MDGAIYHNNPIKIADSERKLLWPGLRSEHPDIVLSIGTAFQSGMDSAKETTATPKLGVGIVSHGKSLYKIAVDHIAAALDSEKAWRSFLSILQPGVDHQHRYRRLNPELDQKPPAFDQVDCMGGIQNIARGHFFENPLVQKIADQLIATSFYFEKSTYEELVPDGLVRCSGALYNIT